VGGVFNLTPPAPADGQSCALQLDSAGNVLVNVAVGGGGGGSNASVGVDGAVAPTSATEIGAIDGTGKLQGVSATNPLPITGSISATNPSVGTTNVAAPTSATEMGVIDSTGKLQGVSSSNPMPISVGRVTAVTAAWTSATAQDTVLSLAVSLFQTVILSLNITGTISAGLATYEVSDDNGVTWYPTFGYRSGIAVGDGNSSLFNPGNNKVLWQFNVSGYMNFRVRLSSAIVGTGTATYRLQAASGNQTSPSTNIAAVNGNAVLPGLTGALSVGIFSGYTGSQLDGTVAGSLDENIKHVGGLVVATAASGVQKVGVVGATGTALDGTTAGVVDENVKNVGGSAVVTAAAGVQKVGVVGSTNVSLETTAGVLDHNLKNVGNAAVVTAVAGVQLVGIEGRAGTSLETTAGVLDENIKNIGNAAVVTAAAGVQKVGVVGNAGATVDSTAAAGAAPTNAVLGSHVFNTTIPAPTAGQAVAQQCDSTGALAVNIESRKATYSAATAATATAGTGVVLQIQGSSTKTIRITRIHVAGFAATAAQATFKIQRASAGATGGTSAALTAGKADINDGNATAVITHWTATGGTAGAAVGGPYISDSVWLQTSTFVAATSNESDLGWTFGNGAKELVLRGTADFITLTCSGTLAASQVWVEWTEE